mgnify:CR=1 FL=1
MYYGNKAKVHIPNWWEIRKMCKGLERLKPQVSVMLEYAGSFDGVPKGKRYLDLSANEDGIDIRPHHSLSDYKKYHRRKPPSGLLGIELGKRATSRLISRTRP